MVFTLFLPQEFHLFALKCVVDVEDTYMVHKCYKYEDECSTAGRT